MNIDDDELMNAHNMIYKMCDYYEIPIKNVDGTFRDILDIFKDLSQAMFGGDFNKDD